MSQEIYLTIVLAMIPLIIGAIYKIFSNKTTKKIITVAKVILFICLLTIIAVSFIFFTQNASVKIEIMNPLDGDVLSNESIVSGKIDGKPDSDTYIWLVVNPANCQGVYWPQNKPIDWFDGQWNASVVLGDDNSSGEKYYIYVISVNSADNLALIENQNQGREKGSFEGIALPSSTKKLAKVAVVRD